MNIQAKISIALTLDLFGTYSLDLTVTRHCTDFVGLRRAGLSFGLAEVLTRRTLMRTRFLILRMASVQPGVQVVLTGHSTTDCFVDPLNSWLQEAMLLGSNGVVLKPLTNRVGWLISPNPECNPNISSFLRAASISPSEIGSTGVVFLAAERQRRWARGLMLADIADEQPEFATFLSLCADDGLVSVGDLIDVGVARLNLLGGGRSAWNKALQAFDCWLSATHGVSLHEIRDTPQVGEQRYA